MAQALNTAYPDLTTTEHIPDEQRIFDRDKIIINYAKGRLNNMRIMLRRFADQGKKATKDMHVKYKSDIARQAMITSTSTSLGTGTTGTIYFSDAEAQLVDDGAILILRDNYYNGADFSATLSATNSMAEALLVTGRGASSGGNTGFTVQRRFGWQDGTGTPNAIAAGAIVLVQPTSVGEGSNEGRVWGDTPEEEYNYCGIFLEKYGQTKISEDIEIYQMDSLADRNGSRTLDVLFKKMEMDAIDGRRDSRLVNGRRVWHSGGLDEYLTRAQLTTEGNYKGQIGANSRVVDFLGTYGTLSSQTLNTFLADKFFDGNETEKFWNMPVNQYVGICNAFDNKVRIAYNKEMSLKYKINISTLETSAGGLLHLTVSDLWSIYGRPMSYIVDYDYFKFMHLRNHDFQIIKNAEKELNRFEIVNYIYGTYGYYRRNPLAHWKIFNVVPS